jgi:hypothetical protein
MHSGSFIDFYATDLMETGKVPSGGEVGWYLVRRSRVADPDPHGSHYFGKLDLDPDPH